MAIAAVAVAVLGAAAWYALAGPRPTPCAPPWRQPLTAQAQSSAVLDATGYVTARRQATVSSKITGRVQEVLIEEGQRVEEGQVLARLDPTDAQAQLDLSTAQLQAARAAARRAARAADPGAARRQRQEDLVAKKLTSTQAAETLVPRWPR